MSYKNIEDYLNNDLVGCNPEIFLRFFQEERGGFNFIILLTLFKAIPTMLIPSMLRTNLSTPQSFRDDRALSGKLLHSLK
jgi:hypothetical protein